LQLVGAHWQVSVDLQSDMRSSSSGLSIKEEKNGAKLTIKVHNLVCSILGCFTEVKRRVRHVGAVGADDDGHNVGMLLVVLGIRHFVSQPHVHALDLSQLLGDPLAFILVD
jgi:hypothetical protein